MFPDDDQVKRMPKQEEQIQEPERPKVDEQKIKDMQEKRDEKKLQEVGQEIKDKFGMEEFDIEVKKIEKEQRQQEQN